MSRPESGALPWWSVGPAPDYAIIPTQRPLIREDMEQMWNAAEAELGQPAQRTWIVSAQMASYLSAAADGLRIAYGQLAVGTFSPRAFRLPS